MKDKTVFPAWGPYGKKYMGISHLAEHRLCDGARFDCTVVPAVFAGQV